MTLVAWLRAQWRDDAYFRRVLLASLALHLLAAWRSRGYHSADEHFQILEFLSYKLGRAPVTDLAVEFGERMRPWFQPALYAAMARAWQAVGVESPFAWAASFRAVTGLVGWASLVGLAAGAQLWLDGRARRLALGAVALLWFLPLLQVRPSSESMSGSFFLLGLMLAVLPIELARARAGYRADAWLPWVAGLCLGFAFEARFQAGFLVAGAFLWLAIIGRERPARLLALVGGFAVAFAIGRLCDRWGYGDWSFSPYHYVDFNLLRGKVNEFGRAPWWDVARMSFTESWPVLGSLVLVATLIAWVRHPRHPLTWAYVPFFLVHEAIAHKELRFFFPIAMAAPVLLALALTPRGAREIRVPRGRAWRAIATALVAFNVLALGMTCVIPLARTVQFYEGVRDVMSRAGAARPFVLRFRGRDPYRVLGTPIHFYRPDGLETREYADWDALKSELRSNPRNGAPLWLFYEKMELPPDAPSGCVVEFRTLPAWMRRFDFGVMGAPEGWLSRANAWTLYACKFDAFPDAAE